MTKFNWSKTRRRDTRPERIAPDAARRCIALFVDPPAESFLVAEFGGAGSYVSVKLVR